MNRLKKLIEQNQEKLVLITVPHAMLQEHHNTHSFDYRAKVAATELYKACVAQLGESAVKIFYADRSRDMLDLNRDGARNSNWRKLIEQSIIQGIQQGKHVYLYDVHSFGPEDKTDWEGKAIVVMYPKGTDEKNVQTLDTVIGMVAYDRDSILNQATAQGAQALLLEFNESKEILSDKKLKLVCKGIVDWMVKNNKQENRLQEMPHVEYLPGKYFDFERERKPGWLQDVVKLFQRYKGREADLVDGLENNLGFISAFKADFKTATPAVQKQLQNILPKEFLTRLLQEDKLQRFKTLVEQALRMV